MKIKVNSHHRCILKRTKEIKRYGEPLTGEMKRELYKILYKLRDEYKDINFMWCIGLDEGLNHILYAYKDDASKTNEELEDDFRLKTIVTNGREFYYSIRQDCCEQIKEGVDIIASVTYEAISYFTK